MVATAYQKCQVVLEETFHRVWGFAQKKKEEKKEQFFFPSFSRDLIWGGYD